MRSPKLSQFIVLLEAQAAGHVETRSSIRALNVNLEDGYCLYNLWEQWGQAFSYEPGRLDALPALLSAARKISAFASDDTLLLFDLPEWSTLLALRGPAECIEKRGCTRCGHRYVTVGTSGFLDIRGLVCDSCGNVHFKSVYDEGPSPSCTCGAQLPSLGHIGCPHCEDEGYARLGEISPFEYFAVHQFFLDKS